MAKTTEDNLTMLYGGEMSLEEFIEQRMHETPMQKLERMFRVEVVDGLAHFVGEESLAPATEANHRKLLDAAEKDPVLALMLITPVKELEGYEYLVPDDFHLKYPMKSGRVLTEKDLDLGWIIKHTVEDSDMVPFFVVDDRTKKMVGFIAYEVDPRDPKVVTEVKLFKFDRNASTGADAPMLIDRLLKDHREVRWSALKKNPAATKGYDLYIKRKERDGFMTLREELKNGAVQYHVKSKTVK
jgi:hypothetical protein